MHEKNEFLWLPALHTFAGLPHPQTQFTAAIKRVQSLSPIILTS